MASLLHQSIGQATPTVTSCGYNPFLLSEACMLV